MAADSTEEEQVEAIKNWVTENGTSLIVGIVLVLGVVFGYRAWETQVRESGEMASDIYEELVQAVTVVGLAELSAEKVATGRFLAKQLKDGHEDSAYAHFAAMHLARLAVENEDMARAADELQWVMDHEPDAGIEIIANMRLAKVKLAQQQYEAALEQLQQIEPGAFESSYEELQGDIYYAMDRMTEAREAYQRAVNAQGQTLNPMTKMKLDDLVAPSALVSVDATSETEEEN